MEYADQEAQDGNYSVLENFNFKRDIVAPALNIKLPQDVEKAKFFLELAGQLTTMPKQAEALQVQQKSSPLTDRNMLKVPINKPLKEAGFITIPTQEELDFLPGKAEIQLNLGLYPAIYKGLATPLNTSTVILMPASTASPQIDRWRIATVINPKRGDYLLAFIYGHISDGSFVIANDENGIKLNKFHTFTFHLPIPFRKEKESLVIFGIVALLLFAGIMRRFRRSS